MENESNPGIHLPDLQITNNFLHAIKHATLKGTGMHNEDIVHLWNPGLDLFRPIDIDLLDKGA